MEDLQTMQVGERRGNRERRPEMGDQPFGLALRPDGRRQRPFVEE